jgi:hypothetical protein
MDELPLVAQDRRPTVRIITCHVSDRELLPILWGLEEEGIPGEVQSVSSGDAVALAKQAAHMSALNVGIALSGEEGKVVLHHRDLADGSPLFTVALRGVQNAQLRLLGTNAARLVKGEPLVFEDDVPTDGEIERSPALSKTNSEEAIDLIVRTVLELLAKE